MSSASTSKVAICNRALAYLKQDPITNIDSPSTVAEVICARTYDDARWALLRTHIWNFAIKRIVLTKDAEAPTFGWANAYNLPNDYVRLVTIGDDFVEYIRDRYELEGNQILGSDLSSTDSESINVRYIYDHTNVVRFDALFIEVLALELAKKMAVAFSVTSGIIKNIREELDRVSPTARAVDGQERTPRRIEKSKYLRARRQLAGNPRLYTRSH